MKKVNRYYRYMRGTDMLEAGVIDHRSSSSAQSGLSGRFRQSLHKRGGLARGLRLLLSRRVVVLCCAQSEVPLAAPFLRPRPQAPVGAQKQILWAYDGTTPITHLAPHSISGTTEAILVYHRPCLSLSRATCPGSLILVSFHPTRELPPSSR